MVSSRVKIGLLVAAHFGGGLFLASAVRPRDTGFVFIGLFTLMIAEVGLLAMWAGLGSTRLIWRLPAAMAAVAYSWGIFVVFLGIPISGQIRFCLVVALNAATILLILSGLRCRRQRKLRLVYLASLSPTAKGFQFSIRHLLLTTAVVAVVMGIGRGAATFSTHAASMLALAILPPCIVAIELAALWAALGVGPPAGRFSVVIPLAFLVGAIPIFYSQDPSDAVYSNFLTGSAIVGLLAIIIGASLLVIRSCGWRLVSGDCSQPKERDL